MDGVKVVEMGVWVAGPAAGGILADWGADVVKIEPPQGDPARTFSGMFGSEMDVNPPFEMDNRSKRSVVLDLGTEEGQTAALELIAQADVFITNIRPAALKRLGLDYDVLSATHPRLIYGLLTGYGSEGPDAGKAAYDVAAYWARSGIADLLSLPDEPPPFQRSGMGDHPAGMNLAAGICAALYARVQTGAGQLVSTSLYRTGAYTVSFDLNMLLLTGQRIAIGQRDNMRNPLMNNYSAGDGRRFWIVGLETDRHWPALCRVVGRPEWEDHDDYRNALGRAQNAPRLISELDEIFATRPLDEWAELFNSEPQFFWSPINTVEDVIGDEQFHAGGGLVYVPDGDGTLPMIATPVDFSGTPWAPRSIAPGLGEHTDEVLSELSSRSRLSRDSRK